MGDLRKERDFCSKVPNWWPTGQILLCFACSKIKSGNSLVIQRLGFGAFTARATVQSVVGEISSHKIRGAAKKKKKKNLSQCEKHQVSHNDPDCWPLSLCF